MTFADPKQQEAKMNGTQLSSVDTSLPAAGSFDALLESINVERTRKLTKRMMEVLDTNGNLTGERVAWRELREVQIKNLMGLKDLLRVAYDSGKLTAGLIEKVAQEQSRIAGESLRTAKANGVIDYVGTFLGEVNDEVVG